MTKPDILFLPSGPGLNSEPSKIFLEELFALTGRTIFWNEPSALRGDTVVTDDLGAWHGLVDSLVNTARSFSGPFVIVTESFGSILGEVLYAELVKSGEQGRVSGVLHSPPTLDLITVFRKVLGMGEIDFRKRGDFEREARIQALGREVDSDRRIDSAALHQGVTLAFESPEIMLHYFREIETLTRWAGGFAKPGFAPEPDMRDRILRGMGLSGAPTQTTFAPDVPTMICAGAFDPYEPLSAFTDRVAKAQNTPGRKHAVVLEIFSKSVHYPHIDEFEAWRDRAWTPFLEQVRTSS